ncbi:cadmium-translocating P-type ATPase [Wenzhouxiangella sp. XN79A]|uniref:heavy metal translocating P-type ATPase n=1 Tax=Wenzhouxiangella sp. XN79A TaxID=2724193 RepID=UPI00144ACD76|nr:heavy metal translocating P-type ATPase [Wenzhouxiangella sp. XN79A]NKI35385.1 cadmium-translocating P-type ATPase [Wenzhouxiangella sp. XN79A]
MSETSCFHCGEPVPPGVELSVEIDGEARPMCCSGCRAVATLIHESGLGRYYDFRDRLPERPEADRAGDYLAWDRDAVLDYHATAPGADRRSIVLVLENVHCAACAWLVNHYLSGFPGVAESRLDVGDGRLRLTFDPAATPLSQLAAALDRLGYPPHLDTPDSGVERDRNERHRMLRYLMVSALGMMQVMSYALAKYIGAFQGMDAQTEEFFRLISMLVAVPVALYAGQPFYRSALRHLMQRHLGIDVPVAAALLIALFSSVLITLFGEGEVYFDSVVMFLFFLLLGRFAVMVARQRSGAVHSALARALPDQARRVTDRGTETVGVVELAAGDRVLVGDGEVVPADGRVVEGRGRVDESLLSGESEPRGRVPGDAVLAGSLVAGGSLTVRIEAVGQATVISGIIELLSEARRRRPRLALLADRAAGIFIAVILASSVVAGVAWGLHDPSRVIPITLAMLVVACPCALALGTPTALAAATRSLAEQGVLTANPDALEALPDITHVMLDKTGTLTEPRMAIVDVRAAQPDRALAVAAALERASAHPIASAFRTHDDGRPVIDADSVAGAGVSAEIDGRRWWLGRADWVAGMAGHAIEVPAEGIWIALASHDPASIATFGIDSRLRRGARELVAGLEQAGIEVHLASGDRAVNVRRIAEQLGIEHAEAGMSPQDKLARVAELQAQGARVAMVGDGINDAPVLAGADIAIALAEGAAIARTQADLVATGRDLRPLVDLFRRAPKVRRVIRQNLTWALTYNISALPLAAVGLVPPWAAAIGMSASSLAVVLNAQRLGRRTVPARGAASMAAGETAPGAA